MYDNLANCLACVKLPMDYKWDEIWYQNNFKSFLFQKILSILHYKLNIEVEAFWTPCNNIFDWLSVWYGHLCDQFTQLFFQFYRPVFFKGTIILTVLLIDLISDTVFVLTISQRVKEWITNVNFMCTKPSKPRVGDCSKFNPLNLYFFSSLCMITISLWTWRQTEINQDYLTVNITEVCC